MNRDFSGGPVVKTPASTAGGTGWIPAGGTRIPHATWGAPPKTSHEHLKIKFHALKVLN